MAKKSSSTTTSSKAKLTKKFSAAASTNSGRVHVVYSKGAWSVKKEGSKRSTAVRDTREGAVKAAKSVKSVERIVIHKRDGTVHVNKK